MSCLEKSLAAAIGAGEGAALVAEEFALEQSLGKRGTVHRHEGLGGARTAAVNGARHQFFARPGFPGDENGRARGSHLLD